MGGKKSDPQAEAKRRLCWVLSPAGEGPWPGLILEWRRLPSDEWQARVLYVPDYRDTASVERWLAAAWLRPMEPPVVSRAAQDAAQYNAAGGAG